MDARDIDLSNLSLRSFIYGRAGSGKTWGAATYCKESGDTYFFDMDAGTLTLKHYGKVTGKYPQFDKYPREIGAWERIMAKLEMLNKDEKVKNIVFDSLTTLSELKIEHILRVSNKKKFTKMSLDLWGIFIGEMEQFFSGLSALKGKQVIMTAHEFNQQDEITGEILTLPLIYGKHLPSKIPLWFDEVYHAEVEQKGNDIVYNWRTRSTSRYIGKSRLGFLPTIMEAGYGKIAALMAVEIASEKKEVRTDAVKDGGVPAGKVN